MYFLSNHLIGKFLVGLQAGSECYLLITKPRNFPETVFIHSFWHFSLFVLIPVYVCLALTTPRALSNICEGSSEVLNVAHAFIDLEVSLQL